MSPEEQGRFCASCQKMVVDFTMMDDREVLYWLTRRQGPTCGRFRQDQLNRALIAAPEPKHPRWRYWHYLVAGLLFSSEVSAQAKPADVQTTQQPSSGHDSQHLIRDSQLIRDNRHLIGDTTIVTVRPAPSDAICADVIRGRVVDNIGNPVPFATIALNHKPLVVADADGYFSIPAKDVSDKQTLTITTVGYEPVQVDVKKLRANDQVQVVPVVLMRETVTLGLVVVETRHRKKANPIADTVSRLKDTLACIGLTKKALSVYPNPVARGNSITLSASLDEPGAWRAQLFSISGVLMETAEVESRQKFETMSMNIPANLAPGAYLIRLSHPALKKTYTQQIVVL